MIRRSVQLVTIAFALGITCFAGEVAHLRNGFTIRYDRREVIGDKTRLYLGSGYMDVQSAEIEGFEKDDTPAPAPAAQLTPAPLTPAKSIDQHLSEASTSSGIDRDFLESVIHHESGFNPRAVSPKGARGLMQLMPDTANQLGVKDSFDPGQNIQGGTTYLKQLLEQYHGDALKALAAYNAGPHRVEQYKGVPPYPETRAYVAGIIREYNRKKMAQQTAAKLARPTTKKAPAKAATTAGRTVKPKPSTLQSSSSAHRPAQPGS